MKSILQPIKPQYCELIASGRKTIEVRKTRPKLQTPFKVYIYMTTEKRLLIFIKKGDYCGVGPDGEPAYADRNEPVRRYNPLERKVIGEYICDRIQEYPYVEGEEVGEMIYDITTIEGEFTCLSYPEFAKYGNGKTLYGWHISDLKIYDEPKELSEFYKECTDKVEICKHCKWMDESPNKGCDGLKPLTRPPQSWCYVEEV